MLALHSRRTLPEHVRFYVKSRETVIYSVFRDFCTKKERETMKIIKRNGSEATFDSEKIVAAITKANNSEEGTRLSPEQIHDIADYVEYKCNKIGRAVSVEEVQDMVENQIMATGAFDLAKHYVQYRYQRSLIRKSNTTDESILKLIRNENKELQRRIPIKIPDWHPHRETILQVKCPVMLPDVCFCRSILPWHMTTVCCISMMRIILSSRSSTAV